MFAYICKKSVVTPEQINKEHIFSIFVLYHISGLKPYVVYPCVKDKRVFLPFFPVLTPSIVSHYVALYLIFFLMYTYAALFMSSQSAF